MVRECHAAIPVACTVLVFVQFSALLVAVLVLVIPTLVRVIVIVILGTSIIITL